MKLTSRIARPKLVLAFLATSLLTGTAGYLVGVTATTDQEKALSSAQEHIQVYTAAAQRALGENAIFNGTINKPQPHEFSYQGSGVVTTVNLAPGEPVVPGIVVATVDSNPVITTYGTDKPIYRDIYPGDAGYDVEAIQEILNKLGYPTPVSGTFDETTEKVAQRFFANIGFTSPCGEKPCFLAGTFLPIPSADFTVASVTEPGVSTAENPVLFTSQEENKTVVSRISLAYSDLFEGNPSVTIEGQRGFRLETSTYTISDFKESQGDETPGYDLTIELPADLENLPDDKTQVKLSLASQARDYLAVPAPALRQDGDQAYVILQDGRRVDVTVEIVQAGWAGLAENEQLSPGVKVLTS